MREWSQAPALAARTALRLYGQSTEGITAILPQTTRCCQTAGEAPAAPRLARRRNLDSSTELVARLESHFDRVCAPGALAMPSPQPGQRLRHRGGSLAQQAAAAGRPSCIRALLLVGAGYQVLSEARPLVGSEIIDSAGQLLRVLAAMPA